MSLNSGTPDAYRWRVPPTAGRLVFKIGEAFPVADPIAVFLVSMSTALNDLLSTTKWLGYSIADEPNPFKVSDVEGLYLLRLSFVPLHEIRESAKHARKDEQVEAFIAKLPKSAKLDLERFVSVHTEQDQWVRQAMVYVRNQTTHYGGKHNWDDLEWAMRQVAGHEGEIEMTNEMLVGMRLRSLIISLCNILPAKFPSMLPIRMLR